MYRPLSAILADLAKPLPPECIAHRKQKGQDIAYVPWTVVLEVLDQYAPGWTAEPVEVYEVCGNLLVKVKLTIRGSDGELTRFGLGWDEDTESDAFGGPIPKAYATALRRAAMEFGLERRLWDGEQKPIAKLRKHWGQGKDVAPKPMPAKKAARPAPAEDSDRAQAWHDLHALAMDRCKELDFKPGQVVRWIRRDYGKGEPHFGTRHLTNEDLQDMLARLGVDLATGTQDDAAVARNFDEKQLRWLRGQPEPAAEEAVA